MKIGFIGLGSLGGKMAANLIQAHYDVCVSLVSVYMIGTNRRLGG